MKNLILLIFISFISICQLYAQDEQALKEAEEAVSDKSATLNFGADILSRYIWRGFDFGNSPAIQPSIYFSWRGLNIGAWGSYSFAPYRAMINDSVSVNMGNYTEMDMYVSYTFKWFTLMFFDYFVPNGLDANYTGLQEYQYFNYDKKTTGHTFEVSLTFAGPEAFPIKFYAGTLVYGNDKAKDSLGVYGDVNKNNFSTYLELAYPVTLRKIKVDLNFFAGGTPFGGSWYGPKAGFTNVGITAKKLIPISKSYCLPVQASFIANPAAQKVFLVFGISF
ncbi:MAG: hypothetical protein NTW31_04035 [Bacteroidetes bacterium]|nr:hypothetical protein [Bacteroidota bacterium]